MSVGHKVLCISNMTDQPAFRAMQAKGLMV